MGLRNMVWGVSFDMSKEDLAIMIDAFFGDVSPEEFEEAIKA